MSEAVQNSTAVNDAALSMLREASNILFDCLSFLAILGIYLITVSLGCGIVFVTALLFGKISTKLRPQSLTALDRIGFLSDETMEFLCGFNILLSLIILLIALSGEEGRFIPAFWHALGVACILFGVLVAIEMVVVGMYSCYVNMRSTKHSDVEIESLAHVNAQQDEASIK
jgi:glucan phosphoethanolaminetransferase (alkaline phosphatase superfamily)